MKMKLGQIEVNATEGGHMKHPNELDKVTFNAKGKRYILNRIFPDAPVVEAWGAWDGNYYLVSLSDIQDVAFEPFKGV